MARRFTAFAIALLEAEDRLSPDDGVGKHLAEMRGRGRTVKDFVRENRITAEHASQLDQLNQDFDNLALRSELLTPFLIALRDGV